MTKYATAAQGLVTNLLEMEEARVESTKLTLPVKLTGGEDDSTRAVVFYSTAGKLEAAASRISAKRRLRTLAERHNVALIVDLYVQEIYNAVNTHLFTPAGFEIKSFHDRQGRILTVSAINTNV